MATDATKQHVTRTDYSNGVGRTITCVTLSISMHLGRTHRTAHSVEHLEHVAKSAQIQQLFNKNWPTIPFELNDKIDKNEMSCISIERD